MTAAPDHAAALLATAERLEAEVAALRAAAAELLGEAEPDDPGEEPDFPAHDLIDTAAAAARAGVPEDTMRYWLRRDQALGCKVGGRWRVSSRRLRVKCRAT